MEGNILQQWLTGISSALGIPSDQIKEVTIESVVGNPNQCIVSFETGTNDYS